MQHNEFLLSEYLDYNPETGVLIWKHRPDGRSCWNSRYSGRRAFTYVDKNGHRQGTVNGKRMYAHRVAFEIFHGHPPIGEIDHINGDGSDNRICNLRDVTHGENLRNSGLRTNNTSGVNGVFYHKRYSCWQARVTVNMKPVHLGSFGSMEDAIAARDDFLRNGDFHENHGNRPSHQLRSRT